MPATFKGIYHNLKESEYVASNREVTFSFSSQVYRQKFLDRYPANREKFLRNFAKYVVDYPYNLSFLADLSLYESIEKRGFLCRVKGVEMSCRESHLYALAQMTKRNTQNWYETRKPKLSELRRTTESIYRKK